MVIAVSAALSRRIGHRRGNIARSKLCSTAARDINRQQFFKKAADHPGPVDEVNFQNPVPRRTVLVRLAQ
jgi:hypothetical protein